jgi:hypothetical protein
MISFNREFIWTNRISIINESRSIKLKGRPIADQQLNHQFYFNVVGLLEKQITIKPAEDKLDTTSILFKRNDLGGLIEMEERQHLEKKITQYAYNSNGQLTRLDQKQVSLLDIQNSREILIQSETYNYRFPSNTTVERENINNYGLAYSTLITERNEKGFLISEQEQWNISGKIRKCVYTYNEKGWVSQVQITTIQENSVVSETEVIEYTYDVQGNLTFAKRKINAIPIDEFELLYKDGLVKAILHQDLQSELITILKYEYTFR